MLELSTERKSDRVGTAERGALTGYRVCEKIMPLLLFDVRSIMVTVFIKYNINSFTHVF